jgi:hypothetical protein
MGMFSDTSIRCSGKWCEEHLVPMTCVRPTSEGLLTQIQKLALKLRTMFSIAAAILENEGSFYGLTIFQCKGTSRRSRHPHFTLITVRFWVNNVSQFSVKPERVCLSLTVASLLLAKCIVIPAIEIPCFLHSPGQNEKIPKYLRNNKLRFMSFLVDHHVLSLLVAYFYKNSITIDRNSYNKICR